MGNYYIITDCLLLLLPVAAAFGWHYGRKSLSENPPKPKSSLPRDYFVGLNYLINEQPDKAVDVFIKLLEIDKDTAETHLALGSLFRRRGEVDRAIRIHQNLIARPQLAKQQRMQALAELAQDYLNAGVLDRAERLFLELIEMGENTPVTFQHLLHIYEQQKDWEQAINIANRSSTVTHQPKHLIVAHYYCELAEKMCERNQLKRANSLLQQAITTDTNSARASILQGDMELAQANYDGAIDHYQRVMQQDHDYLSEIIPSLCRCYEEQGRERELTSYLQDCLVRFPRISVVLALADNYRKWHGDRMAIEFIATQIQDYPSLRGLLHLIDLYLNNSHGEAKTKLIILRTLVADLLAAKPIYRCHHCGFAAKSLYWQCPKCRLWSTVKPIHGVEGD